MAARTQRPVTRPAEPTRSARAREGNKAAAVQLTTLAERSRSTGKAILIHGPTGAGKTVLAIHKAPRPVLVLDCDNGLESVLGTDLDDEVYIWTPADGRSEYDWSDLDAFRNYVLAGRWEPKFKTIVVDNATAAQKPVIVWCIEELIGAKAAKDDGDESRIDPDVPSRQAWGKIYRVYDRWIRDIRDAKRRGAHVIFTSGTSEWLDDLEGYTRLMPDIEGKVRNQIATHFDAVGWLEADEEGRKLHLAPSGAFVTKVRVPVNYHGSVPDVLLNPDFNDMIRAVEQGGKKRAKAAKKQTTSKPTKARQARKKETK